MAKEGAAENLREQFYRHGAEAGSLISADYNQAVLTSFYQRLPESVIHCVCDVGSGMGRNLPLLRRHFPRSAKIALDLSFRALQSGRSAAMDIAACVADALSIPLKDKSTDLVVCTEVLEHVADLDAAVDEIARILRPGGFCIISSPNYRNPMGVRKWLKDRRLSAGFWDPWDGHPGFERLMTPSEVDRTVTRNFDILVVRGAGFIMAWTALGYPRIGKRNDRFPMLAIGRLPLLRNLGMNRYLLLQRRNRLL